jgi:hypothetical protein
MAPLTWDNVGERYYETGVDHGVLYIPNDAGVYNDGVAWNGLVTVTESPSGAESNPQYADNIKYLNLISAEEFGATIEAFTYPDEFGQFDGSASPAAGVSIGQQGRKSFGLSYRTRVGNDLDSDAGYKLHLVYGCQAAPSEKAYGTINDSPEAITFSWEVTTSPVGVGTVNGVSYKPTAIITIDSTKVDPDALAELESLLYGTNVGEGGGSDPFLPTPATVIAIFTGDVVTTAQPTAPTYNAGTKVITIPTVTGVTYRINGDPVGPGALPPITEDTIVTATPNDGYVFPEPHDEDWFYDF